MTCIETIFFFQLVSPNLDVLQSNEEMWSLSNIPLIDDYLSVMDGDPLQKVIKAVVKQYKSLVAPRIVSLRKGNIDNNSIFILFFLLFNWTC